MQPARVRWNCPGTQQMTEHESHYHAQKLILVGTVHHDPDGFEKSLAFLASYRPDAIFIELSPYGYRFRRKNRRRLNKIFKRNLRQAAGKRRISLAVARSHFEIRNISRQLALPFEYRAAARYAKNCDTRVVLVDSSPFSRRWISFWPELIATANLQNLLGLPQAGPVPEETYGLARRAISKQNDDWAHFCTSGKGREDARDWVERERFMAERIRTFTERQGPSKSVYLGGWWHLTKGNEIPTIRDLLKLDASQCHLLA